MENHNPTGEDRLGLLSGALTDAVAVFRRLDNEGRSTLLKTLATLFAINAAPKATPGPKTVSYGEPTTTPFSREQSLSPKEFLLKKQPQSDVERVACLAYYLAHYRDQIHFKTADISTLNTEAAQRRFSNTASTVRNATNYGYLAPAIKGMKQLSAGGEIYVEASYREAANSAMAHARPEEATSKIHTAKKGSRIMSNGGVSKRHRAKRIAIDNHKGGVGKRPSR